MTRAYDCRREEPATSVSTASRRPPKRRAILSTSYGDGGLSPVTSDAVEALVVILLFADRHLPVLA
jgi:hypothetical protein